MALPETMAAAQGLGITVNEAVLGEPVAVRAG
jgi:hypothetical protein